MKQTLILLSIVGLACPAVLAQPAVKPTTVKPAGTSQPVDAPKTEPKKEEPKKDDKKVEPKKDEAPAKPADPYVLGYKMKDIDGKEQNLSQYKGKVILIVNVASQCGYTKQYIGLEALYETYKDKGFTILAFPANNFRNQEPGTDADIKKFCSATYDVKFPIFSKISVKGSDQHELYKQLAAQAKPVGGDPQWNFTKFLVNKEGKVVARFEPNVEPSGKEINGKVRELLGLKDSDLPKLEAPKTDPKKDEPKKDASPK